MFNYLSIDFINSERSPKRISYFYLNQDRYAHEIAVVRFKDWDVQYNYIKPGEPVRCLLRGLDSSREFIGYIHDIKPDISPGKQFVELTLIGASYKLKQARQRVYYDTTASQVIKQIAKANNFSYAFVKDHPRVYQQIIQAGHTDLELMTKLAKQCGYTLRIQNTTVYFEPLTSEYTRARASAPSYVMRAANDPKGSTLYSFKLLLGESVRYTDSYKSNAQVGGVDPYTIKSSVIVNQDKPTITRETSTVEFFDSFATNITAPGYDSAAYEAYALDVRNRFPYRANIEVAGTADIAPDKPIYLSGIGGEYSGYWVVLSVQHRVSEESPNILKYTTVMQVGTDSLGSANVWEDNLLVPAPEVVRQRVLTAGERNEIYNDSSVFDTVNSVWISDNVNAGAGTAYVSASGKTTTVVSRLEKIGVL